MSEVLAADEPHAAPPAPQARIFLCYRRGADNALALRLSDRLKAAFGAGALFHDVDSIPVGTDFFSHISEAVRAAEIMLVVIGPDWLTQRDGDGQRRIDDAHDWMRFEVTAALQRNLRVIPLLVGGARMPSTEHLPADLQPLALRQAFVLSDAEFENSIERLLEALDRAMKESRRSESADRESPPPRLEQRSVRVFLSSTHQDLVEHRKAVLEAREHMPGIVIAPRTSLTSESGPLAQQLEDLASCDLLISIVAWRYGFVPSDLQLNSERQSVTEVVFRIAKERNMPTLAFLADREQSTDHLMDEATGEGDKGERVRALRKLIADEVRPAVFGAPSDLALKVTQAVWRWMGSRRLGDAAPA